MKKISPNIFIGYLILLIVAGVTSTLGIYIGHKVDNSNKPIPVVIPQPSDYPDFDAIKGVNPDLKIKKFNITSACPEAGCVNDKSAVIDFDGIDKRIKITGRFSRAYLYAEVMVDYTRPLTVWGDLYFMLGTLGGHLIPDSNVLPVPPSAISRYLYDLRSLSYYPRNNERAWNKAENINFFSLFQNGITLDLHASISSDRPGRVMKEVSIYYECADGNDCAIEGINK